MSELTEAEIAENVGVDMVATDFTCTKCVNGDVVVSFMGDILGFEPGDGMIGGPFTIRIPQAMRRDLEMCL